MTTIPALEKTSRIRICLTGFNYFPGQGLTIFFEYAINLSKLGVEVMVVAPGRAGEPIFEVVEGIRVFRVPTPSIGRMSADRVKFLVKAALIMRQHPVDIGHVFAFVGAGLFPWIAGRRSRVWLYDCQTGAIKPPLLGLQNWLIRAESVSFDAITVLSEGIRDLIFGAKHPVDAIVPLGANLQHFQPRYRDGSLRQMLGIEPEDCVLVYCGTLDHNRKMHKLIDAFSLVARTELRAKLLIIGEGSALTELKQRARHLMMEQQIVFTGFVSYEKIPTYLAIADIALAYISMDACFEYQPPTKTVEYLAQGLPVIATDTTGNRVFVKQDVNGVVSADDANSYGQAILDLIGDPVRRQRLATSARKSILAYDWAEIVHSHMVPVYQRLLRDCLDK